MNIGNDVFRAIKAVTPGSYTFILPATKEVPRRRLHPRNKTVGGRIPHNRVVQALLAALGEPPRAGALRASAWRYCAVVAVFVPARIALPRSMMAGRVAAAVSLPLGALVLRSPDWPFALLMGVIVYWAHQKRFIGMLQGKEPKFYTQDAMGPRG